MAQSKNILLFGDFDSRCGKNADYIKSDQFICDLQGIEELFLENSYILNHFDSYHVALQRNSADLTVNFYGQQLLDLCKYNTIFLMNGRIGTDKHQKQHAKTEAQLITSSHQHLTSHFLIPSK